MLTNCSEVGYLSQQEERTCSQTSLSCSFSWPGKSTSILSTAAEHSQNPCAIPKILGKCSYRPHPKPGPQSHYVQLFYSRLEVREGHSSKRELIIKDWLLPEKGYDTVFVPHIFLIQEAHSQFWSSVKCPLRTLLGGILSFHGLKPKSLNTSFL